MFFINREDVPAGFRKLADIDHRFWRLEDDALHLVDTTRANRRLHMFYHYMKPSITHLAGWERIGGPSDLKTSEAYEYAYFHILYLMTDTKYRRRYIS